MELERQGRMLGTGGGRAGGEEERPTPLQHLGCEGPQLLQVAAPSGGAACLSSVPRFLLQSSSPFWSNPALPFLTFGFVAVSSPGCLFLRF